MALVQMLRYENMPVCARQTRSYLIGGNGTLHLQAIQLLGSLSFNQIAVQMSASGTTAKTLSLSFGLYSINGASLSLANSAFRSSNPGANALSWLTMATSAAQNITPGVWYLGFMSSTAGASNLSLQMNGRPLGTNMSTATYAGPFFRGIMSVSTTALPAAIATSDCKKEFTDNSNWLYPYVLISA